MPNFFVKKLTPKYHQMLELYLEEYTPYIVYCCEKKRFLKNHWEDMESFIKIELIKLFHKKYKYTDFDWVVRCVIRRKVTDFVNYYMSRNKNIKFDNQLRGENDDIESVQNEHFDKESMRIHKESKDVNKDKNIEVVKSIYNEICQEPTKFKFNDWDRELFEVAIELYELGYEVEKSDLLECMGYEQNELQKFTVKLLSLRNKIKANLGIDLGEDNVF